MRGLVMDIKNGRAIVLKDDGGFANVKNKNYKVGQRIKAVNKSFANSLKIAACIALCLITSTAFYKFYHTPYSYLYIDINPSVRFDLNYFDIVIKCTPLNSDAEFIEVSSGNVEDSINEVITKCEQEGFLTEENNEIEINISKNTDKIRGSVSNVENKYKSTKYNVVVKDATDEESRKANEQGISVKRQRVIEEFSTVFGGDEKQNSEKLQDKTTKEINILISNKQKEDNEPVVKESEKEETVSDTVQWEKPAKKPSSKEKRPVKIIPPKQESASVTQPPKKENEESRPMEEPQEIEPDIKEPEHKAEVITPEVPEQDMTDAVPEKPKNPENGGETSPPYVPEEKKEDAPTENPVKENHEPPAGNMGEDIKESDNEGAPPTKEPIKQPSDNNEHQSQPPAKGERPSMPSDMPAETPPKEHHF